MINNMEKDYCDVDLWVPYVGVNIGGSNSCPIEKLIKFEPIVSHGKAMDFAKAEARKLENFLYCGVAMLPGQR